MSISTLLACAILGLLAYIVYFYRQRLNYWQSRGIACEQPSFMLGNLTGMQTTRSFPEIWLSYYNKFKGTGPFAGFYWFQRPAAFILDKSLIKNIMIKDFAKFTDRGFYNNPKDDPLSAHLFNLDGDKWRSMRNKLSPTFTSGKMKFMFPTVVQVGHEFINVLGDMITKDTVIEVKELLSRFTTDVIGTCAFGIDCNSLEDPQAEFRIMGKKAVTDERHGIIGNSLIESFPELSKKLHMKLTPTHIEEFFLRVVRETVSYREQNDIRRNDFMDMLIDLKNDNLRKSHSYTGDNGNISVEEVAAQAFVFFLAGFETSSSTMSFALYELAQNQEVQQKAREEVQTVLAKHNQKFTYECMKELQYLEQIINETLRLYTILPIINRFCLEDYVVPGHPKYVIKKGQRVLIPINAIHRDADYYPNPDVFNPDNFLPEVVKERDNILHMPFGDGPRNCIGMRFGLMQTRTGLALLLKDYKFSVCSKTQIPIKLSVKNFLVDTESGIYLKVEKL